MTLNYEHGCPAEWTEGVKELTAKWTDDDPPKFLLTGPCPRCKHPISMDLTDRVAVGLAPGSSGPLEVIVRCTCGMAHPGAPVGRSSGCGAEGTVSIKRE